MSQQMHPQDTRQTLAPLRGVIPYVNLRGKAAEAAEFYARAFGAQEHSRVLSPHNPSYLMHVRLDIHGGALMMSDHIDEDGEAASGVTNAHMQLVTDDGARWWARACEAGCREVVPFGAQPWGDKWGMVEDPFGIQWAILELGDSPECELAP